jgi:hypothetical protein
MAVTGNLTVTGQTAAGYIYLGPYADNNPSTSTLNFPIGDTRANAVTLLLPLQALSVTFVSPTAGAKADVIFDVTGYYDSFGLKYHCLSPQRILDSRAKLGLTSKLSANVSRAFQGWSSGGVPVTAQAITGNLTVTNQTAAGFLYLGPYQNNTPSTSTLNFPKGDNRANAVSVFFPTAYLWVTYGAVAGNTADVLFDVTGYYE